MRRHQLNWRVLLDVDTPPCVSIYLPGQSSLSERKKQFGNLLLDTHHLIRNSYSKRVADRIGNDMSKYFDSTSFEPLARGEAFFISPEIRASIVLETEVESRNVVANSFHLAPLLFSSWINQALVVHVGLTKTSVYGLGTFQNQELRRLTCAQSLMRLLPLLRQHSGPVFFSGLSQRKQLIDRLLCLEDLHCSVEDLGQLSAEKAIADARDRLQQRSQQTITIARSQRDEKLSFDINLEFKKLLKGKVKKLLVSPKDLIWGTLDKRNGYAKMQSEQRDAHDNCLVDTAINIAFKRGIPIEVYTPSEDTRPQKAYHYPFRTVI